MSHRVREQRKFNSRTKKGEKKRDDVFLSLFRSFWLLHTHTKNENKKKSRWQLSQKEREELSFLFTCLAATQITFCYFYHGGSSGTFRPFLLPLYYTTSICHSLRYHAVTAAAFSFFLTRLVRWFFL